MMALDGLIPARLSVDRFRHSRASGILGEPRRFLRRLPGSLLSRHDWRTVNGLAAWYDSVRITIRAAWGEIRMKRIIGLAICLVALARAAPVGAQPLPTARPEDVGMSSQ